MSGSIETGIRSDGTLMFYRESVEEIGPMIEQAERFAVAITQSESDTGAELVWLWAAEYVDARLEVGGAT